MGDNNMGTLTNTQRKVLTKMLGVKCYHEYKYATSFYCSKCKSPQENRTFDTWQDFGDVVRVMDSSVCLKALKKVSVKGDETLRNIIFGMKQPDFIEKFMKAVCELKGVKG